MVNIEEINELLEGPSEFIGKIHNDKMTMGKRITELEAENKELKDERTEGCWYCGATLDPDE